MDEEIDLEIYLLIAKEKGMDVTLANEYLESIIDSTYPPQLG